MSNTELAAQFVKILLHAGPVDLYDAETAVRDAINYVAISLVLGTADTNLRTHLSRIPGLRPSDSRNKIQAIKAVRTATKLGLKESKELIDQLYDTYYDNVGNGEWTYVNDVFVGTLTTAQRSALQFDLAGTGLMVVGD